MTEDKDIRIIALKCPNCGGALRVSPGTDKAQCEHCKSTVLIVDAKGGEPRTDVSEVVTEEAAEAGRRALKVILWSVLISVAAPISQRQS